MTVEELIYVSIANIEAYERRDMLWHTTCKVIEMRTRHFVRLKQRDYGLTGVEHEFSSCAGFRKSCQ